MHGVDREDQVLALGRHLLVGERTVHVEDGEGQDLGVALAQRHAGHA